MATAAAIGGIALAGSAIYGAKQAEKGAKAQARAADKASDVQYQMFQEGLEAQAPWREAGGRALTELEQRVISGPGEYTESPGYQFRLGEGLKQIQTGRGNVRSGATEKALQRYAQDYAASDYDNFLQRYYQSLTPLQSLAQVGQTTAAQGAQMGQQTGAQMGQNIIGAGQARASGYAQQANILNNLISQGVGIGAATYGGPGWGASS